MRVAPEREDVGFLKAFCTELPSGTPIAGVPRPRPTIIDDIPFLIMGIVPSQRDVFPVLQPIAILIEGRIHRRPVDVKRLAISRSKVDDVSRHRQSEKENDEQNDIEDDDPPTLLFLRDRRGRG